MDRHHLRTVSAAAAALLASGLLAMLLSAQWGVAAEYGYGDGTTMYSLAPIPVLAGCLAVALAGWRRRAVVGLTVFALLTMGGLPVAGALGQRTKEARAEQADARFTCNGRYAELLVPQQVDAAWHEIDHPAPYWLYGPIEGTGAGCTAGISGDDQEGFRAWREALLRSGWRVVDDVDATVTVTDNERRAVLRRAGELTTLTMTSAADTCRQAPPTEDGVARAC